MDLSTWMKWVCVWRSAGDRSVVRARRQPICLGEGSRADPGFSPLCFTRDSWLAQHPWRIVKKGGQRARACRTDQQGACDKEPEGECRALSPAWLHNHQPLASGGLGMLTLPKRRPFPPQTSFHFSFG